MSQVVGVSTSDDLELDPEITELLAWCELDAAPEMDPKETTMDPMNPPEVEPAHDANGGDELGAMDWRLGDANQPDESPEGRLIDVEQVQP